MIVHYLVIWMIGSNMTTRKETAIDIELDAYDTPANERYDLIKEAISMSAYGVPVSNITIINICRL